MKTKAVNSFSSHLAILSFVLIGSSFRLLATPEALPESDAEISEYIAMDVGRDSHLASAEIRVDVEDGIATLRGSVDSLAQAERSFVRAMANPSIRAVVSLLEVEPKSDSLILRQARAILKDQSMMVADDVSVSVSDQRVILEGEVGTWDERELARELVSEVAGAAAIENRLEVTPGTAREDSQIAGHIRFLIQDDPLFDGLDLAVTVNSGSVEIRGQVGSGGDIGRLVRHCHVDGVKVFRTSGLKVNADLAMEGLVDKEFDKGESLAAIADSLRSDPRIMGRSVKARLRDGVLTLSGNVADDSESDVAEFTARGIPGVERVVNNLDVSAKKKRGGLADIRVASPPAVRPRP